MDFPSDEELKKGPPADAEGTAAEPTEEEVAAAAEKKAERLQLFGSKLAARRDAWLRARAAQGLDRQWAEDIDQYNGKDSATKGQTMMKVVEQGGPAPNASKDRAPTRSTIFVQVTRAKTNSAAARLADVVQPGDERNFSINPTTEPSLPRFVTLAAANDSPAGGSAAPQMPSGPATGPEGQPAGGQQPAQGAATMPGPGATGGAPAAAPGAAPAQPLSPIDEATRKLIEEYTEAKKRAEAMQKTIDDALGECDYDAEVRKAIHDAALLGTAVMEGPVVVNRTRKVWTKKVDPQGTGEYWTQEVKTEFKPASFRLDPRFFVPDPQAGENVQNGRGALKYRKLSEKQVRDLAEQPAYVREQLRKVIEEGPKPSTALTEIYGDAEDQAALAGDSMYELWTYWGEADREDCIAAGVEVPKDDLESISVCIEMINSTVVRAFLNPLVDGKLPFDTFAWERRPGLLWGYGVPTLMRAQQRVINAAWRMILDNAGVSSGPQIIMKQGAVQPADGNWTLYSRKLWLANDDVDDVTKAFATFEIPSRQKELQAIIEMAEKLSDQETSVPFADQGDVGTGAAESVGGMQMRQNLRNVMLRRQVKNFDDGLTKPHIRAYYDYHMEYSEREDIKGDFAVFPLGSSTLVKADIQNQAITNMLALGGNPVYSPFINLKNLFKRALKAQHIDPTDVMNDDAEIARIQEAAAKNAPKDPRLEAAEVRANADIERTKAQVQMNEMVVKAKEAATNADAQLRLEMLRSEREIEMMKLAQKENVSLETIRAQLAATGIKERSKQDMQARELELAAARGEGI
jgi:hypothetical protein